MRKSRDVFHDSWSRMRSVSCVMYLYVCIETYSSIYMYVYKTPIRFVRLCNCAASRESPLRIVCTRVLSALLRSLVPVLLLFKVRDCSCEAKASTFVPVQETWLMYMSKRISFCSVLMFHVDRALYLLMITFCSSPLSGRQTCVVSQTSTKSMCCYWDAASETC